MKGTYLDDYLTELTTITLDNDPNRDELGSEEAVILSAKRYAPIGPYQTDLDLLKERVFTEISMKPLSEIRGLLIRLEQAKKDIERAKAVFEACKPKYGEEFDWYNFGLRYFTLFKISLYGYEWQPDSRLKDYLKFSLNCKSITLDSLLGKTKELLMTLTSEAIPSALTKSVSNVKPEGLHSLDEEKPKIYIPSQMQTRLFKTLSGDIPKEQDTELELLLTNGYSENRVWVKLRADSLAYVFKQAIGVSTNPIKVNMKEMSRWLATYFRWGENNPKAVSEATAYKVLRGNTKVDKDNQIRLKP